MSKQNVAFDPEIQSVTPLHEVGEVHIDKYGRQWIYGRANGAITAGYWCDQALDGTYDMTHTTTARCGTPGTDLALLAVANIAMTDNYYGWFWIGFGTFEAVLENSYAAGSQIYTTSNAGIPGTNSSSFVLDGVRSVDAGVTATRVTVWAAGRLVAGVVEAAD